MPLRRFVTTKLPIVLCTLVAVNCSDGVDNRYFSVHAGEARAEVIKRLGPPTSEKAVAADDPDRVCSGIADKSEMDYDLPRDGLAATLREWLRLGPSVTAVVCLDSNGVVTQTNLIEY